MDCDASFDPRELLARRPTRSRPGPPTWCSAPGGAAPGRLAAHARLANRVLALELRRRTGVR